MLKRRRMINSKSVKSLTYKTGACIDIHCETANLSYDEISKMEPGESSSTIRERVIKACEIQEVRFKNVTGSCHSFEVPS